MELSKAALCDEGLHLVANQRDTCNLGRHLVLGLFLLNVLDSCACSMDDKRACFPTTSCESASVCLVAASTWVCFWACAMWVSATP